MKTLHMVLNLLFFLPGSVWLGGLVMLALSTWQIERILQGRRTEAWQIVRKVRGLFQRIELGALAAMWIASVAQLVLETLLPETYPGTWGTADAMKMGLMVIPTLAALYSTYYLTGAIVKRQEQLGSYADKDGQIQVRRRLALLHLQAKAVVWVNALFGGLVLLSAVAALG